MRVTLTQVSNIFNMLVQAMDDKFLNYHAGKYSDINREIDNNFDAGNETGRMFPAVHLDTLDLVFGAVKPSYIVDKEPVAITLYFYDLQDIENDGEGKTKNLIEQKSDLKDLAYIYMANYVELIGVKGYNIGYISEVTYMPRQNIGIDKLIRLEAKFTLTCSPPCVEDVDKIDPKAPVFINPIPTKDIENTLP
jgi:hypothetical protein